ncbi:MAG: DNA mismatch repair protein MutS [Bacillota bacterium]
MSKHTPMVQQYLEIKQQYPDAILLFRLGDFYEMFFDDAELAARELEITLTGRDGGLEERIPMCGVPYHALEGYLAKLISKGYCAAICEQVEDPKQAKGIVRREVIRVVTPGTVMLTPLLDDKRNNFLVAISRSEGRFGLASTDVSTGEFAVTELQGDRASTLMRDELSRLAPVEAVVTHELTKERWLVDLFTALGIRCTVDPSESQDPRTVKAALERQFGTEAALRLQQLPVAMTTAGMLLSYLRSTQKTDLQHINRLSVYQINDHMLLDTSTRRSLELVQTMRDGSFRGSLLSVVDRTETAMGARLLRQWVLQPMTDRLKIEARLDAVGELKQSTLLRQELSEKLTGIYDLERLMSRVAFGTANARDLLALRQSLAILPEIRTLLTPTASNLLQRLLRQLPDFTNLVTELGRAIQDDPPLTVREGGIIRTGYHPDVDRLRSAGSDGKRWIAELEQQERERTGIRSLKVGYNKVFGYYLEITNSNLAQVPTDYIRKQTLANAERFVTPALKEMEETILGAQEKVVDLEYQLFISLRDQVAAQTEAIQQTAQVIAQIDCLLSLANVAIANRYVRPELRQSGSIQIKEGRHPVVERMLKDRPYVPNDLVLDGDEQRILIITGPNMAGKSTYLRMAALIVLMAQMGSFVPASSAQICLVDRIFTRVGTGDDLAGGQSTFMVEMAELSQILASATAQSLLVLDEIGRGTSTFDGMSIARAVIEHIHQPNRLGAKTLFATHYHELTDLEQLLPGVKNYSVAVKEKGEDVVFLHRIIPGGVDKSYGIAVAKLAGLPRLVINRAKQILAELENNEQVKMRHEVAAASSLSSTPQLSLLAMEEHPVVQELRQLDVMTMTPIEALNRLYQLQQKVK